MFLRRPIFTITILIYFICYIAITTSGNSNHNDHNNNNHHPSSGHHLNPVKTRGHRSRHPLRARDVGHMTSSSADGYCELEVHCKGEALGGSLPVKLPIKGPKGPPGLQGEKGERGADGVPGFPGIPAPMIKKKVAFFAGLTENFGPVTENSDIIFDKVVTNIGSAYSPSTGRFTAPVNGAYQFNVVVSAQGREKAAVMVLKNGEMVATVWAESIPFWGTSSNIVVLSLDKGDQVWLLLLNKASHLHGYMYTTFSGFIIFDL